MKPLQKPNDPLSNFSLQVFHMNGLLMRSGDIITSSIGQSSARWQVLGRLGHGTQTVANIARDMGLARQSVQRIADALTKEGLAVYQDHAADRRTKIITITSKGAEVLNAIYVQYAQWNQHLMTKLNLEQLETIADALNKVGRVIEEEINSYLTDKNNVEVPNE
ncbi:MarR family winged helix-turn-helix transcriptional regulator [Paenibacillus daejeonensis]|uniref:MarR family winged helix-turn-helix transcriptional regulator n=1 Tax=Paenibacillus daejeonensis TaxID=135193 RepID=UPI000361A6D4|nr:MarR family transcriptional regulator [Paenibacillus daejeonensis]